MNSHSAVTHRNLLILIFTSSARIKHIIFLRHPLVVNICEYLYYRPLIYSYLHVKFTILAIIFTLQMASIHNTRSTTDHFLIGQPSKLPTNVLPTVEDIVRFYHYKRIEEEDQISNRIRKNETIDEIVD